MLLPVNGWDDAGYRLGYGGGYFDRTLAALAPRPRVIGTGYECARLETIYPQSWDMPLDYLVTERGVYRRDGERLEFLGAPPDGEASARASPVCYAAEIAPGYFGEDRITSYNVCYTKLLRLRNRPSRESCCLD